eukprot:scaffold117306_cov14-Tisochrysis_lutea.AAC.1
MYPAYSSQGTNTEVKQLLQEYGLPHLQQQSVQQPCNTESKLHPPSGRRRARSPTRAGGVRKLLCVAYFAMALLKFAMQSKPPSNLQQQSQEFGCKLANMHTTPDTCEYGHPLAALSMHALAWIPCYLQAGLSVPLAATRHARADVISVARCHPPQQPQKTVHLSWQLFQPLPAM